VATRIEFNKRAIEALIPPVSGRAEYKDSRTPGLYVRVTPDGVRTFSHIGRPKGSSRSVRTTIGTFPAISPDVARREARRIAGEHASGRDLSDLLRNRREELTFQEAGERYLASLALTAKRADEVRCLWERDVKTAFSTRRLSEIDFDLVQRWHRSLPAKIVARRANAKAVRDAQATDRRAEVAARQAVRQRGPAAQPKAVSISTRMVTGEVTANHCLNLVRAIFNWCMHVSRRLFPGPNPASGHKRFAEHARERFLRESEIERFFLSLSALPNPTMRDYFLMSLLTGARARNVASMKWDAVDLVHCEWRLSGSETKNGKPQVVPLTEEAVQILRSRLASRHAIWVFSSELSTSGHIESTTRAWNRVLRVAKLHDLRRHDLRRTLGSWLARTGASLVIIGKTLNHLDPSATAIYARLDLDPIRHSMDNATSAIWAAAGAAARKTLLPDSPPTESRGPDLGRET